MTNPILSSSEKELFNRPAIFEKEKSTLILSERRIIVAKKNNLLKELDYTQLKNVKHSKIDENSDKNKQKLRIVNLNEESFDISFKGEQSIEDLKNAVSILKQKMAENKEQKTKVETPKPKEVSAPTFSFKGKDDPIAKGSYLYSNHALSPEQCLRFLKPRLLRQLGKPIGSEEVSVVGDLYERLIGQQIVSPDTFWVNYKSQIAEFLSIPPEQQTGYSGQLLSDVVASNKSRGNETIFDLPKSAKRQIMRKKPDIARLYLSYQNEMLKEGEAMEDPETGEVTLTDEAENQFWKDYFKTKNLEESENFGKSKKKNEDDDNIFNNKKISFLNTVSFHRSSRHLRYSKLPNSVRVTPLFEHFSAEDCGCSGCGIFNREIFPHLFQKEANELNMHSELSLIDNGIVPDTTRTLKPDSVKVTQLADQTELEDLNPPPPPKTKELVVEETTTKPPPETVDPSLFRSKAEEFADQMEAFSDAFDKMPNPPIPSIKEAEYVLKDITGSLERQGKIPLYGNFDLMKDHSIERQNLLFNFWTAYLSPKRDEKQISQLKDNIQQFCDSLDAEERSITSPHVAEMLQPVYQELREPLKFAINPVKDNPHKNDEVSFHDIGGFSFFD